MTNYSNDTGVLSPSFDEAALFLEALAGKDAPCTFQTFDDMKVWSEDKKKFINRANKSLAHIYHGTFNQHKNALAALNAKGAGVFVTVNETDLTGREAHNIQKVRALFLDLDGSPRQPILDLPEDLQPHIWIESSPNRWHAYWLVNNCELDQFKPLQQALAALFDGDKQVCDLPRVMRLAGFSHNKQEPFITRIVELQEHNLTPFSVNKLIVGLGLNNIRVQERPKNKQPKNDDHIYASEQGEQNHGHHGHHGHTESDKNDDFDLVLTKEQINDLKSALSFLSCEDYKEWTDTASALKTVSNSDDVGLNLWLEWSSKSPKFDHAEAVNKWHNDIKADRTNYKAIFAKAQANGWQNPQSKESISDAALSKVREALKTGDVGAMFEDATIEALKTLYNTSKSNYARARLEIKQNRSIKLSDLEALIKPEREGEQSTTEQLLDIAKEQCEFFHDKDGETYASFIKGNHRECHRLQSKSFKEWLANELYKAQDTAPADNIINATINALNGQAKFDGDEKPVYMRVAKHDGDYWLDLCNDEWQAVKITSTGWQVINTPDVLFTRGDNMRALPTPTEGGDINLLWPLVNIPKHDNLKIIAWLIESLRPDTPYPVLEMTGEQGSVKSTSQKHLRKLIDPNKSNLRAAPKTIEDIWVTAKHGHIVSFENISHLSAGYQDALCVLATGGAYATRTLHTTSDETVIELKKPVMLNGIPVNVTAQDLLDRTLHIDLPVIESRITESEIETLFDKSYQSIFSGLLDIFVKVLGILPTITDIERHELPRMADFALLGEAVYRLHEHPPKTFLNEYHEKRTEGIYRTLEASPVAVALLAYLEENPQGYDGTVKRLLDVLTAFTPQGESWPRSLKGFGDMLRRLAPAFRSIGYSVIHLGHKRDGHHWQIKRIPTQKSAKQQPKRDHGDHGDRDTAANIPEHIYNSAQNGATTTIFDDVESF